MLTYWGWDKISKIFTDGILKSIFFKEIVWIFIKISQSLYRINNIPTLVQIMAWRLTDLWVKGNMGLDDTYIHQWVLSLVPNDDKIWPKPILTYCQLHP